MGSVDGAVVDPVRNHGSDSNTSTFNADDFATVVRFTASVEGKTSQLWEGDV